MYEKKFKRRCEEAAENGTKFRRLILDVSTRWNSSMLMMQRALQQREMITFALAQERADALHLSEAEWKQCKALVSLLKPFHHATKAVSSQSEVTISRPKIVLEPRIVRSKPGNSNDLIESDKKIRLDFLEARKNMMLMALLHSSRPR